MIRSVVFGFAFSTLAFAGTWEVDASHSHVEFKVKHMMVTNVKGSVENLSGRFEIDDKDASKMTGEAWVEIKNLTTHNEKRDQHLQSADFFDAKSHPKAIFKIKKTLTEGGKWKLVGDLTMRGVTKEVTFESEGLSPVQKDPWGNVKRGFSAAAKINRQDFGIKWQKNLDAGGVVVSDTVDITVDVELDGVKKAAKK